MGDKKPTTPKSGRGVDTDGGADWAESPIYKALSARLEATETTLANLGKQVAELAELVQRSLPNAPLPTGGKETTGQAGLSIPPNLSFTAPSSSTPSTTDASGGQDGAIAALTQQISALSTSVAQLQRLQTSQASSRPSSGAISGPTPGRMPFDHNTGPLTAPLHPGPSGYPNGGQPARMDGAYAPGGHRPAINRSISSTVLGAAGPGGGVGEDKWGSPGQGVGRDGTVTPGGSKFSGGLRDLPGGGAGGLGGGGWPSPGGMLSPGGVQAGLATPGAGIVITKWEHLNLKVELLRGIAKYGIGPPNKIQARVLPFMLKGSDIIAQAPPTQERIISYVIPALQLCLSIPPQTGAYRGPAVIIITTTVDQATQCHKLLRSVGGPLGIRAALAAGAAGSSNLSNEITAIQREAVHALVGTPAKLNEVMVRGVLGGSECRLFILDEVDQLIARNLYEHVLSIAKLLPPPRGSAGFGNATPGGVGTFMPGAGVSTNGAGANANLGPIGGPPITSPYDPGHNSPFNPNSKTPFPGQSAGASGSRFGPSPTGTSTPTTGSAVVERQTCLFSNTVPTDVINFSQSLNVRDPVRVLVRRDGGPNSQESVSSVTPGINLKHTYVYLTITGGARSDGAGGESGPGTIGSGRGGGAGGAASEEASRAKEYKLDILGRMLDDYPLWQAIIYVGTFSMLEAVVYKLQSRSWETLYLTPDMSPPQRKAILQQWRSSAIGTGPRFLVIFDVNVKPPEIPWSPLVINFDLPRSVEGYAHRAAAAVPPTTRAGPTAPGVIVSFVQAAGGDVEMLRSTECAYRFKSAEIPSVFHDLFQH